MKFFATMLSRLYLKQIEGFPEADPSTVYLVLQAIYGLRQSSHKFYCLLRKVLEDIGLICCEVDHALFYGHFTSSPHLSIPMLTSGNDLVVFMPVHVMIDDGLVATNSLPLHQWILGEINKIIEVNDLGAASLYLGICINQDCPKHKLWLSQKHVITDLLTTSNMLNTHPSFIPLCHKLHALPEPPPNSLPDIPDSEIKVHYQHLVGSLLYLALCTWPDIAYAAMALGQFNASPTHAHLLAAKGVLHYLLGTLNYALEYNQSFTTAHRSSCFHSLTIQLCLY